MRFSTFKFIWCPLSTNPLVGQPGKDFPKIAAMAWYRGALIWTLADFMPFSMPSKTYETGISWSTRPHAEAIIPPRHNREAFRPGEALACSFAFAVRKSEGFGDKGSAPTCFSSVLSGGAPGRAHMLARPVKA
jgi:hypothetical protein